MRETPGQFRVPRAVRSEPDRHTKGNHFDVATERVPGGFRGIDAANHLPFGSFVEAAPRTLIRRLVERRGQRRWQFCDDAAELRDVAPDVDSELAEQLPTDRPARHAGYGFPGAGTLEDVARIAAVVLEGSGKIRVSGPRPGNLPAPFAFRIVGFRRHDVLPMFPIAIPDQHRDG